MPLPFPRNNSRVVEGPKACCIWVLFRLLPLINLNWETALLRSKSLWRTYCLFVDHSSVC